MENKTGGSAFPTSHSPDYPNEITGGMTLRDYFAAKALSAAMTTPWRDIGYTPADHLSDIQQHARLAYQIADAMLAERSKPTDLEARS